MNETPCTAKQLDEIYDAIDALMCAGVWNFLDELFLVWEAQAWRMDLDIKLVYATASLPAKSKIPNRKLFMNKCKLLHPDLELWKGLE